MRESSKGLWKASGGRRQKTQISGSGRRERLRGRHNAPFRVLHVRGAWGGPPAPDSVCSLKPPPPLPPPPQCDREAPRCIGAPTCGTAFLPTPSPWPVWNGGDPLGTPPSVALVPGQTNPHFAAARTPQTVRSVGGERAHLRHRVNENASFAGPPIEAAQGVAEGGHVPSVLLPLRRIVPANGGPDGVMARSPGS